MKNSLTRYALGLGLSLGATSWALAAQPLLNPEQLQPLLQQADVRLIDIRDPKAFEAGHIAQAANAPYGKWRGPATNPGELPDQAKLVALVQSLGLTPATHAIVISSGADATDFGAAARVYWTLKSLGLKELSIVNGGMKAWESAGKPLGKTQVQIAPSSYAPTFDANWLATQQDVGKHIDLSMRPWWTRAPTPSIWARPAHPPPSSRAPCPAHSNWISTSGLCPVPHGSWMLPRPGKSLPRSSARKARTW